MSDQLATTHTVDRTADFGAWLAGRRRSTSGSEMRWQLARAIGDVASLTIAGAVSGLSAPDAIGDGWHGALVLLALGVLAAVGAYSPRRRLGLDTELRRVVGTLALVCMSVGAIATLAGGRHDVSEALAIEWLVASVLVATNRVALFGAQRAVLKRASDGGRTLIVGAGRVGHLVAQRLLDDPALGMRPIGYLDKDPLRPQLHDGEEAASALHVLGASYDLEQVVRDERVEHVVVAFSTAPSHVVLDVVRRCWALGVDVTVVPRLFEVEGRRARIEHLGALPVVALNPSDPRSWQFAAKYAIDRLVAGFFLILVAPLFGAVALTILVSSGRPILFRQRRIGRDGHAFEMLKFRTMRGTPEDGGELDAVWASLATGNGRDAGGTGRGDDDRRTGVGAILRKLSIDELPQLWNVVRGDMSLIGPRPERVHYVEQFEHAIYRYPDRHRVKSGLTGWAQVNGLRGETSLADRIEWDNFYIENWSPWLDLKILVRTIPTLLAGRGAR